MGDNYKIRLRKGDFELEVEGDKEFTISKFEELASKNSSAGQSERGQTHPKVRQVTPNSVRPTSIVEFFKSKKINSHTDRVVVFAYFLYHNKNMESINSSDIEDCYSQARVQKPQNTNDAINLAVSTGYLTPVDEKKDNKKAWTITQSGEKHVEVELG